MDIPRRPEEQSDDQKDDDGLIAAAFIWKPNGNYIRFWKLVFEDGLPVIQY
jgi:hypothetical protein